MKKITISQIAKEAGVSTATVSRALHHPELVKEASLKKIREIVTRYNYQQTSVLNINSQKIGIIIPEIDNLFFSKIINTFLLKMAEEFSGAYDVLFTYSQDSPDKEYHSLLFLLAQECQIIVVIPTSHSPVNPNFWQEVKIPIIWLERYWPEVSPRFGILSNKHVAAYEAANELIQQGARSILLINGTQLLKTSQDRTNGLLQAVEQYGLDSSLQIVEYGNFSWEHGYKSIFKNNMACFDAIITGSGRIAQGALQALYETKLNIPKDIALISFDETSEFFLTSISTIYFSGEEMAAELLRLIQRILQQGDLRPYLYYLNAHKVLRGSEIRTPKL